MSLCMQMMEALHLCIKQSNCIWHTMCTNQQWSGWAAIMYMLKGAIFANIVSKFSNYLSHCLWKVLLQGCPVATNFHNFLHNFLAPMVKTQDPSSPTIECQSSCVHETHSDTLSTNQFEDQICKICVSLVEALFGDVNMMSHILVDLHWAKRS